MSRRLEAGAPSAIELPAQILGSHHYSGRFNVRIGTDLHRALAFEAARQGVSLNQLVARKLASETRINA